jgi:hypothetical protein
VASPGPCQTVTAVDGYSNPQSKRFSEPLLLPRIRPLYIATSVVQRHLLTNDDRG